MIIEPHEDANVNDVIKGMTSRKTNGNPPRCESLKEIRNKIGNYEAVFTRDQICSPRYKIKLEDFLNESAFRSQGLRPTSYWVGTSADTKLQKFFGLNKKTPQEIAIGAMPVARQRPEARASSSPSTYFVLFFELT